MTLDTDEFCIYGLVPVSQRLLNPVRCLHGSFDLLMCEAMLIVGTSSIVKVVVDYIITLYLYISIDITEIN